MGWSPGAPDRCGWAVPWPPRLRHLRVISAIASGFAATAHAWRQGPAPASILDASKFGCKLSQ